MKPFRIPIFFTLLVASGCNSGDLTFPVIGIDQQGNPQQVMVTEKEYSARLGALVSTANDSVLPVLKKSGDEKGAWAVRTFLIGLGASVTIGIGPWKVGALPQTRIVFTNSSSPTLP